MTTPARLPARVREDHAKHAGAEAQRIITAAERTILAAMTSAVAKVAAGSLTAPMARRRVRVTTSATLGAASARLQAVYGTAVHQVTGEAGPLPDAPGQVAKAILRAQADADVAFGAVLAAAGADGARMPPPSSPYRKIVSKSLAAAGTPGSRAARLALEAVGKRGLTGHTDATGKRQPLATYAATVTRTAVAGQRKPTLQLKHLTGVWALVYGRRAMLLREHTKAVAAAWDASMAELGSPGDVAGYLQRDASFVASSASLSARWWQVTATGAATTWLDGIYRTSGYPALAAALDATIRAGMAEGEAAALALAADRTGAAGFSIGEAFSAALARIQGDPGIAQQAQAAAGKLIGGAAYDAGRALASVALSGGGKDEMSEAAEDATEGSKSRSVDVNTDWALWAAIGAGALALYSRAARSQAGATAIGAVANVDWITAGDDRVCAACQFNQDDGPYPLADVPQYPDHARCRCYLDSSDDEMSARLMAYYFG